MRKKYSCDLKPNPSKEYMLDLRCPNCDNSVPRVPRHHEQVIHTNAKSKYVKHPATRCVHCRTRVVLRFVPDVDANHAMRDFTMWSYDTA